MQYFSITKNTLIIFDMKDYIIIGAGLSGLVLADKIFKSKLGSVLTLEKSRGIGGRVATRRTLNTRFDHGAQFYRLKSDSQDYHQLWDAEKITHQWFVDNEVEHWCANIGMTALTKSIAAHLEVQLESLIHTIKYENAYWKILSEKGEVWTCRKLIVSAPLPQVVQLLERSALNSLLESEEGLKLKNIHYSKALIALVTLEADILINKNGYEEFPMEDFFSLSDQKQKGISPLPAITITMSENFSEKYFEESDEIILELILSELQKKFPAAKISGSELKKWRYCRPISTYNELFLELTPNLFIIGDAFGGASLLGAMRSANALARTFIDNFNQS